MLTDKQIEALYAQIRWRIDAVNDEYLQTVGEQINAIGKLNPSSIRKLAQMRKYGANSAKIKKKLQEALNMSADEVQGILDQAAREEYKNYDFLGVQRGRRPIPVQYNYGLQTFIKAVAAQTAETFQNYSNTTSIDEEYKEVVSQAVDAVARGVTDYNQAIRSSMRKLGGDGLRVTYTSKGGKKPVTRRLDTAIRMNILDSVRQVSMQAAKMAGEEIGADGMELSAHPFSALDHEDIQGRMYTMENYQKMQTEQPFEDVDGKQYDPIRRPITQWNCRHFASPVLLGISQRRYTDEQLAQWKRNNHAGCEIGGEHYTIYQASQLMRKIETEVRKQKDIANTAKAYGDDVLRREAQAKITQLKAKYNVVAEQSKLRVRPDKMVVESYKSSDNVLAKGENNGIIQSGAVSGGVSGALRTPWEQDEHAELYYEEIRNRKPYADATKISENIRNFFTTEEVEDIRQHMFIREQPRDGGLKRFDPDYYEARAWQRLIDGKDIHGSDIVLLQHEMHELTVMRETGCQYEEAHEMTNKIYNWFSALMEEMKE